MLRTVTSCLCLLWAGGVAAQSLSPQDIAAMVDQRVGDLSPYQQLLNDPDPARSMAAMSIMLESGDTELLRMAREYGLLSTDPAVQKAALSGYLGSRPTLTLTLDGSAATGEWSRWIAGLNGAQTPEKTGYIRFDVTGYDSDLRCFTEARKPDACFLTINADGVFMSFRHPNYRDYVASGRFLIDPEGQLAGFFNITQIPEPVPATMRLLD